MRRFFILFLIPLLSGCVVINLPRIQPLVEKTIGGRGADKVLIIDISGEIIEEKGAGIAGIIQRPAVTARIREELDKASEDDRVKAVVLRINSPGGVVTTCDIIYHEIKRFKKRTGKVVVAELMDVAASGGYYIAAASDKVVAHPTTITGSIGVVALKLDASGLLKKIGIANETIKSGDKKDIGTPLRSMTGEERKILQSIIDGMFQRFLTVVKEGRKGLTEEALKEISDGRVFLAPRALELGLVDRLGYLEDAIEVAKKEAGIEEAQVVTYTRPGTYKANIYSEAGATPSINIVNIDMGGFAEKYGVRFMYMWMP